jgi:hypothetical protein
MPLYNQNYWQNQVAPFNSGLRTIGSALAQMPMMRAMANERALMGQAYQARAAEEQAMAQEAGARNQLLNAQTSEIQTGDKRIDDAQKAAGNYMSSLLNFRQNPTPQNQQQLTSATTSFASTLPAFKNVKVGDLVNALGRTGALNNLMGQQPDFQSDAGLQGEAAPVAVEQMKLAAPAANQVTMPNGSTLVDRATGQPVATSATTLAPGATRIAPQFGGALSQAQNAPVIAQGSPLAPKSTAADAQLAELVKQGVLAQNTGRNGTITNTPANLASQFNAAMGNVPQGTTQTATQGANQTGFPPVPPYAQRVVGQKYSAPKGVFIWGGTNGWLPVNQ